MKNRYELAMYEIFYINKHKPVFNTKNKFNCDLTLELEELDFSNLKTISELGIDIKYYLKLFNQRQIEFDLKKKTFDIENKKKLIGKIDSNYSELFQLIRKNINELNSNSFYKARDLLVIKLVFYAGLKTSEMVSLNWTDIDMKDRVINIRIKNNNYIMPMDLEIKNELENYLENSNNDNKELAKELIIHKTNRHNTSQKIHFV
ncbi:site-specific integrase [Natroniella sp. ANB-PHB2]|uniref:site-specific integrase n=1 Tax=Natroniella sp. ANB-PHB2 TaxID=3384444 RepID=UPI0038D4A88D